MPARMTTWRQIVVVVMMVVMLRMEMVVPQTINGYIPPICAEQEPDQEYLAAVATSCRYYYACAPGHVAALMRCPDDTLFDITQNRCNHADDVDCGNRPLEDPRLQPSLRINAEPALYQLMMTEPFTSSNLDLGSCQQLRQSILDQLRAVADCSDHDDCPLPTVLCQPVDDLPSSQETSWLW